MDWKDVLAILNPVISIFVMIIGGIVAYFGVIAGLKTRLTKLETQMEPFWGIIQSELPKLIHSPHTPEIDALLEKMMADTLTKEEAIDLKTRLKSEMSVPDLGKKLTIVLLIARLDTIIKEKS
jgi:hypothetical protein